MTSSLDFFRSSLGKKIIMAVTGFIWIGFVVGHMVGNLQIYQGAEKINAYAKFLKDLGPLLWVARIVLLVSFVGHVVTAILLKAQNTAARPVAYKKPGTIQANAASLTMIYSGLLLLTFLLYHLAHFTLGLTNPEYASLEFTLANGDKVHDVYAMVVQGFQVPAIAGAYIFFMVFLSLHLSHATSSIFQTLGIVSPKHNPSLVKGAYGFGLLVFIGNSSMPLAVLFGLVK
jgi:succinate dehydrogenase / fumarate reductase, cytochrome b subunit